jgi:3-hydroxyisobutyrate dehydrogenase
MRKDFALAVDAAERVGAKLALGEKGLGVYTDAMNDPKCKDLDSRVVYRYLGGDEEWQGETKEK